MLYKQDKVSLIMEMKKGGQIHLCFTGVKVFSKLPYTLDNNSFYNLKTPLTKTLVKLFY